MKHYELENKCVLFKKDEKTGEQEIVAFGDCSEEYENFYSISNYEDKFSTLCIPLADHTILIIEKVTSFDADYEENGFILYQKDDENGVELNFAYLFEENKIIKLGIKTNTCFFINEEEGKKQAAYTCDEDLCFFNFISYFEIDDELFFETEAGKLRIFSNGGRYYEPDEIKDVFHSVKDRTNDLRIFFQRDGELFKELIRTKTEIQFHNAYLKHNELSNVYELYGFKDGKPFLLGSGCKFEDIDGNVRIDNLIWLESNNNSWLLQYEPKEYVAPNPEPTQESSEESKIDDVNTKDVDDANCDRYFGTKNQPQSGKKPWWKFW